MKKLLALSLLGACVAGPEIMPTPPGMPMDGNHLPETPPAPAPRAARRLSVAQLRTSIPALFGTEWTATVGRQEVDMLDALAGTLGEPDYIMTTQEDLSASPLFAKFLDDLASNVCRKSVAADEARAVGERLVVPWPEDPDRTLRFLRLKLHAIDVPEGSTDGITELRALYDAGASDPRASWITVCVAMLTAPEFLAY